LLSDDHQRGKPVTYDLSELDALTEKAVAAMKRAIAQVVEDHRRRGKPLAVWKDGRVVQEYLVEVEQVGETVEDYRLDPRVQPPDERKDEDTQGPAR
jgi:hypothetical protein